MYRQSPAAARAAATAAQWAAARIAAARSDPEAAAATGSETASGDRFHLPHHAS